MQPTVGGGDCPPSCQPTDGHCRARQSGRFLEIGSLLSPLAALRRFPRRPAPPHFLQPSVGADAYIGPPYPGLAQIFLSSVGGGVPDAPYRPPLQNLSLRGQCAHWPRQSVPPSPHPLPKGYEADRGILFPHPVLSVRPGLTPALQPLSWPYPRRSKKSRTPRVPCTRRTG